MYIMATQQENPENNTGRENKDDSIGGVPTNTPDPETQNDTGYAGTTNAVSEDRQHKDSYRIAPEDTMIGYDGNDEQMNMDLDDKDRLRSGSHGGGDNND
jgi:hypothetical protein